MGHQTGLSAPHRHGLWLLFLKALCLVSHMGPAEYQGRFPLHSLRAAIFPDVRGEDG